MKKKKKDDCVSEIWFRKFYDPNDVGKKIISAFEPNGSKLNNFDSLNEVTSMRHC